MTGAECCRFIDRNTTNQLRKWYNKDVPWMTEGEACVHVFMRVARLVDSVIEPAMFCSLRFREGAAGKPIIQDSFSCGDISKAIRARWRLVSLGADCHGNRIAASEAGQVDIAPAAAKRNVVTVPNPEP